MVSAIGVAVVTAALVCVLSILNGFGGLIEQMFSAFDPELKITAVQGKCFRYDTHSWQQIQQLEDVAIFSPTIEETALLYYDGRQIPATIKGVDTSFQQITGIDSLIVDGQYCVYDGAFERCVLGRGLAAQIGIGAYFVKGLKIYAPKRTGQINLARPDNSFTQTGTFIAGIFAVNQAQYDDRYMIVNLPIARKLFSYGPQEATAIEIKLSPNANLTQTKQKIQRILGEHYQTSDRYEQQADFFKIMRIEKLLTTLLLVFILLIAVFNIIGSLSLLMIDKKADMQIMRSMGASTLIIQRIFLFEGWLISILGALIGMLIGIALCSLQEHFALLKLGNGYEYVISAYPVQLQVGDLIFILSTVLLLGFIAAWIPSKKIKLDDAK